MFCLWKLPVSSAVRRNDDFNCSTSEKIAMLEQFCVGTITFFSPTREKRGKTIKQHSEEEGRESRDVPERLFAKSAEGRHTPHPPPPLQPFPADLRPTNTLW